MLWPVPSRAITCGPTGMAQMSSRVLGRPTAAQRPRSKSALSSIRPQPTQSSFTPSPATLCLPLTLRLHPHVASTAHMLHPYYARTLPLPRSTDPPCHVPTRPRC